MFQFWVDESEGSAGQLYGWIEKTSNEDFAPAAYIPLRYVTGEMSDPLSTAGAKPPLRIFAPGCTARILSDAAFRSAVYVFTFGLGRKNCVRFGSFQISQVLILFEYRCAACCANLANAAGSDGYPWVSLTPATRAQAGVYVTIPKTLNPWRRARSTTRSVALQFCWPLVDSTADQSTSNLSQVAPAFFIAVSSASRSF